MNETFVSQDGRVIEVIERVIEIPYWSPLGRHVQHKTVYEYRERSGGQGVGAARSPQGEDSAP